MDAESVAARPRGVSRLERVGLWVAVVVGWISVLNSATYGERSPFWAVASPVLAVLVTVIAVAVEVRLRRHRPPVRASQRP